jgi:hypothetical protein
MAWCLPASHHERILRSLISFFTCPSLQMSPLDRIDHEPVLDERLEASHPRPSVAALVGSTPGVKGASTQGDGNDALACTLPIQQHCNVRTTAMAEFAILICSMHSCPLKDILACGPGFGESETPRYS